MSASRNKELFKLCLSQTNAVLRPLLGPASNKTVLAQYGTQVLAQIQHKIIYFQFQC